jgi:hypothetical protein
LVLRSVFFAAAGTELTGTVRRRGPGARWRSVSADSLPELTLAVLFVALESRQRGDAANGTTAFAVEGGPEGPWLTRLPDSLRDAIGAASADELRRLTASLLGGAETLPADAIARAALHADLVSLARAARAEGKSLCLWISP